MHGGVGHQRDDDDDEVQALVARVYEDMGQSLPHAYSVAFRRCLEMRAGHQDDVVIPPAGASVRGKAFAVARDPRDNLVSERQSTRFMRKRGK